MAERAEKATGLWKRAEDEKGEKCTPKRAGVHFASTENPGFSSPA